jgi:chemotaxis protein MotB
VSGPGQPIIVVRKKVHHGGHHGGAWKVAYADFVTAMMAFFLVLWLVGQSKEVKASVSGYFRDPTVLELPGGSGVLDGGPSLETVMEPAEESAERERLEAAVSHIRGELANHPSFQKLRDQVEFSVTPEGLRIDLVEKAESSFFDSGSSTLRGETERILAVIAHELGTLQNDVVIEGHTDSRAYAATERYSNWELASDRANAARRVMERSGLRPKQIGSVAGLADRHLRVPDNPLDPRNRRVSILVRNPLMQRRSPLPVQQDIRSQQTVSPPAAAH